MKAATKLLFAKLMASIAKGYGVDDASKDFTVTPSVHQTLHDKIQESDEFLKKINVVLVDQITGEKVLGSANLVPGTRVNTALSGHVRLPANLVNLANKTYALVQTNFDAALRYSTIDSWAKFKDFQKRYSDWVTRARALAIIRTGWHGITAAAETDSDANPNGEDVNIGWYQRLRAFNSGSQVLDEGATTGEIRIGAGGDFENLDTAVYAAKSGIDHKFHNGLVAIVGSDLIQRERSKLYAALGDKPTEKEKLELMAISLTFGGLPIVENVPFFPERGLFVTALENLSYYQQEGSMRRNIVDNSSKDQVEDFNSVNDGYVIENEEAAYAFEFENVMLPDGEDWA